MPKIRIYGDADPYDLPAYPMVEVAHFLWIARSKAARWAFGYEAEDTRHQPVIRVADPQRRLPFNNLAELHVLSALRYYNLPLQRIRKGVNYLRHNVVGMDHPHPLLARKLHTDGIDIFIEQLEQFQSITKHGQGVLRQLFEAHLRRIERDPNSIDPIVSFGRPVVIGTGVPTVELANRFSAGEPIESLSLDLDLPQALIEEAIRYQLATRVA
jgi:uncharacterized protein (DUF433 family)